MGLEFVEAQASSVTLAEERPVWRCENDPLRCRAFEDLYRLLEVGDMLDEFACQNGVPRPVELRRHLLLPHAPIGTARRTVVNVRLERVEAVHGGGLCVARFPKVALDQLAPPSVPAPCVKHRLPANQR
jgi:hypothetical protein